MADTGFKLATAGASETLGGSSASWVNPGNITASDNARATSSVSLTNTKFTDYLVASGFDFSAVAAGATINGVEVRIERSASFSGQIQDNHVYLRKGSGGTLSSDNAAGSNWPTVSDAQLVYGTSSSLWGLTLSVADLASLQVLLSAKATNTATPRVDAIDVRITYTPPSGNAFSIAGTGAASPIGASTAQAAFSSAGTGAQNAVGRSTASATDAIGGLGAVNGVGAALRTQGAIAVAGQGLLSATGRGNFLGSVSIAGLAAVAAAGSPANAFHLGTAALSGVATSAFADGSFEIWLPQTFTPEGGEFVTFSDGAFFSDGSSFGQDEVLIWTPQQSVSDVWTPQTPGAESWSDAA
ncbi:MAG: hypothetical protein HY243_15960 [Proteobacteria bacterium]|nr:hypothetical protein [Pseudomonadota bacterium]